MSETNIDRVHEYFDKQYVRMEGNAEENVYALFAEEAIIQLASGETVAIEDIARSVATLRQVPESERSFELSDFEEKGDTVTFRSFVRFRHPETGEFNELDSDALWRFNEDGRVVESRSGASIAAALQSSSD